MGSYIHFKDSNIIQNQKILTYSGELNIQERGVDLSISNQPTTVDGTFPTEYLSITVGATISTVDQNYVFTANFKPFNSTASADALGIKYSLYSDANLTTFLGEYYDNSINTGPNISENIYGFFSNVLPSNTDNVRYIEDTVYYYVKAQIVDSNYSITEAVKRFGYGGSFSGSLSSFTPTLVTFPANTVTFNNFFNPYNNFDSSNSISFTGSAYSGTYPRNDLVNIGVNGTTSPGVTVQNPSGDIYFQILSNNTLCPVMGNIKDSLNSTAIAINSTYDFTNGVSFIIDNDQNYVFPFTDTFTMILVGGGGGSSYNYYASNTLSYGGNAGEIQENTITIQQNDVLEITIGAGGAAGSYVPGSKGGNTIVTHKREGIILNTYTALGGGAYNDNFSQGGAQAGKSSSDRAGKNSTYGTGGAGHQGTTAYYPTGITSGTGQYYSTYYPLRASGYGAGGTIVYVEQNWAYGNTGGGGGFGSVVNGAVAGNSGCVFFTNQ